MERQRRRKRETETEKEEKWVATPVSKGDLVLIHGQVGPRIEIEGGTERERENEEAVEKGMSNGRRDSILQVKYSKGKICSPIITCTCIRCTTRASATRRPTRATPTPSTSSRCRAPPTAR